MVQRRLRILSAVGLARDDAGLPRTRVQRRPASRPIAIFRNSRQRVPRPKVRNRRLRPPLGPSVEKQVISTNAVKSVAIRTQRVLLRRYVEKPTDKLRRRARLFPLRSPDEGD
jgi:hypothetical protein